MAILRLDPRHPIVWRTPTSLQVGGREPVVILEDVTTAEERMLVALRKGVPDGGLAVQGRCSSRVADGLLERVGPALLTASPPALAITVRARDATGRRLAELASALGLLGRAPRDPAGRSAPPAASGEDAGTTPDPPVIEAGIVIGSHAIPPTAYRDWLRRDLPHLGVVLGEAEVRVSPVVRPGRTPCLRCTELHHRDADPCWPAIAAQLVTRPAAAADDPMLRVIGLATAVRRLREALHGDAAAPAGDARTLCIAADGTARAIPTPPHRGCGCLVDLQTARAA